MQPQQSAPVAECGMIGFHRQRALLVAAGEQEDIRPFFA
jgi:hypothetical protein